MAGFERQGVVEVCKALPMRSGVFEKLSEPTPIFGRQTRCERSELQGGGYFVDFKTSD